MENSVAVEHFHNVGQSLPELTTELLSAHTSQASEIELKQELLERLEAELHHWQEQLQTLTGNVCSVVRTICLKEDLLARLSQEYSGIAVELPRLVEEKETVELKLQNLKKERDREDKARANYESKMKSHQVKIEQLEQLSSTQIELQMLRENICSLKQKTGEAYFADDGLGQVLSGEKAQYLQDQIMAKETSRNLLRHGNSLLQEKLSANRIWIQRLRKDIATGRKQQGAQLKRLQRLVSDAQARKRQWVKMAEQLRANIDQIKQRNEDDVRMINS